MAKRRKQKLRHRDAKTIFIWGRNGTGKSTLAKKMIDEIGERALIVTFNGAPKIWRKVKLIDPADKKAMESFKGLRHVYYRMHNKDTWKHIFRNFKSGTLLLDDNKGYLPANIETDDVKYFKNILMDFRHNEIDIIVVAHGPRDIPNGIWPNASVAFVGATAQRIGNKPIDSIDELSKLQKHVNSKFKIAAKKGGVEKYNLFYPFIL